MDPNVKLYFCPTNLNNSLLINDNNDNCSSGFYKCIGFERGFLQQCKFSSNLQSDFHSHLQHEHEFTKYFCRYCFLKDSSNRRYFRSPIALITHLDKIHKNQHFQCNCCSYRAITADHVNLHQLFCHQNVCQENRCIYQKTPPQNSSLKLKYFYDKYRIEHIAENRYRYQCLYCKYCSNIFQETIQHLVRLHPEFPLLYYDDSDDDDDEFSTNINNNNNIQTLSKDGDHHHINNRKFINVRNNAINQNTNEFCCFFCDEKFSLKKKIRDHLIQHLFDSNEKIRHEFFENWIQTFISKQHYFKEFYPQCPICLKLGYNPIEPKIVSKFVNSNNQHKEHYMEHSSFQKFKCLICFNDQQIDYWLKDSYHYIINHMNEFHSEQIQKSIPYDFKNNNIILWQQIKHFLQEKSILMEYTAANIEIMKHFNNDNLNALKRLEEQYQRHLSLFFFWLKR
uniref:Uncharacterized protein LOC113792168 n=1 Tax=Dermatophagoides pteronyssinus TaxID=6956 RepID=A0A6P6XWX6_DERPT|nr:uncharacterized protein LOC113792168 [Dermatophagoides pteronyssinus]